MKFTLSWLKQHLDTGEKLEAICDKLTAIGLEFEAVHDRGKALAPFIIAHVLTAEKHPDADRLKVTTVDTGKEKLQVVCGAPNCHAGMKAVLARPGDVMPDNGEALKKGMIRGVESQGMLCAADELKLQDDATDGIIELPADAPVGENFARYAGYDDPVIEINLTPNRPDCAGVYGIARDLAAAGIGKLKPLEIKPVKGKEASRIRIELDPSFGGIAPSLTPPHLTSPARGEGHHRPVGEINPQTDRSNPLPLVGRVREGGAQQGTNSKNPCPLFVGRLIRNIKNGPSPKWLQERLRAIGLRPISALVDITNYLTFDCARPLHVFDAKKIKGNLWVRPARGGEKLAALNGNTYTLEAGMTAIGDDTGVLSLAGIMGGAGSACDDKTTDVLIESALFDPARTARTGRALQISSDARYRFERGVDPLFTVPGAELATKLVIEFCGMPETVVSELEIAGKVPDAAREIILDTKKCLRHAGVDVPVPEQEKILAALGFKVSHAPIDRTNPLPLAGRVREGGAQQGTKSGLISDIAPSLTPPT
jgi:phenylalanyl-tRNA synthetase beta chain